MPATQTADEILERTFLEMRARVLEVAAALARIERADDDGQLAPDPRLEKLHRAIELLNTTGFDRAERVQMIFSDEYQPGWNNK